MSGTPHFPRRPGTLPRAARWSNGFSPSPSFPRAQLLETQPRWCGRSWGRRRVGFLLAAVNLDTSRLAVLQHSMVRSH